MRKITGRKLDNAAIGDPGLLAARLVDIQGVKKKYALGIIPHYVDKNSPLLSKIKIENARLIDIQQNPADFLAKIAECENVISSAMHGLIAADSLGIPNIRMILSDKIVGGDYKYDDYYSAFGIIKHAKIDLRGIPAFDDLDFIRKSYRIRPEMVERICDALSAVFPYKIRDKINEKTY